MEKINQIITKILSNENLVENLQELEIVIKEDEMNVVKPFVVQKGVIEYCVVQFEHYRMIEREKISGICTLLTSLLVTDEMV